MLLLGRLGKPAANIDLEVNCGGQKLLEVMPEVVLGQQGYLCLPQPLRHIFDHEDHEGVGRVFFL